MQHKYSPRDIREMLEEELLRDLILRYPELMPILGRYEIEYDNVAGRTFVEAARMHGYAPGALIGEAMKVVTFERR